jgi:glycosyltransferase involved in cell wall biosynthesis
MGDAHKIRVLHMIDSLHLGGTEKQCYELIRRLDRNDFDVRLITLNKEGPLYRKCLDEGITLQEYKIHGGFYRPASLFTILKIASYMRREKVHVVQTYGFYSTVPGMLAAVIAGVPARIAGKRELSQFLSRKKIVSEKSLWKLCDCIVVNAPGVKEHLVNREGIDGEAVEVILNGVNFEEFAPAGNSGLNRVSTVGMVANFREQKDHKTFLQAAALVLKRRPGTRFVCIGRGVRETAMKNYARSIGLEDKVIFVGKLAGPQLIDWMRRLTISVLASSSEGMSNALIESMALSIPVIANPAGGIPDFIRDGVTGYLFPYEMPDILAEKILFLIDHPDIGRKMGEAGRRMAQNEFQFDTMIFRYQELYRKLYKRKVLNG